MPTASAPASRHRARRSGNRASWSGGDQTWPSSPNASGSRPAAVGGRPHLGPRRFEAATGLDRGLRQPPVGEATDPGHGPAVGAAADPDRHRCRRQRRETGGVDHFRSRRCGRRSARSRADAAAGSAPPCARRGAGSRSPSAWYSTSFHPMPTPRRIRPGARSASVATCLATSAVWRCGNTRTSVTSSSEHERAMYANSTSGSRNGSVGVVVPGPPRAVA